MTKFTKAANFILRGTIVTALGATVLQLASGGTAFETMFKGANKISDLAANVDNLNFSNILTQGHIVTIALLVAAILSCVAFKCAGKAISIFRTLTLFGLTGLSTLGTVVFTSADLATRTINDTASATEIVTANKIMDVFAQQGQSQAVAIGSLSVIGTVFTVLVAAVLTLLTITSVVSVVKTVKAPRFAA